MKKILIVVVISAFVTFGVSAKNVYVKSFAANIHADSSAGSAKVAKAKKGEALTVISEKAGWVNVKYKGKAGWVKTMFISEQPAGKKVSILGSAKTNVNVHVRKRASADVTAASARGLQEDTEMEARLRGKPAGKLDPAALDSIEALVFSSDELYSFLEAENIQ